MGSDIFAKFSAYIKNSRKEANSSKAGEPQGSAPFSTAW